MCTDPVAASIPSINTHKSSNTKHPLIPAFHCSEWTDTCKMAQNLCIRDAVFWITRDELDSAKVQHQIGRHLPQFRHTVKLFLQHLWVFSCWRVLPDQHENCDSWDGSFGGAGRVQLLRELSRGGFRRHVLLKRALGHRYGMLLGCPCIQILIRSRTSHELNTDFGDIKATRGTLRYKSLTTNQELDYPT